MGYNGPDDVEVLAKEADRDVVAGSIQTMHGLKRSSTIVATSEVQRAVTATAGQGARLITNRKHQLMGHLLMKELLRRAGVFESRAKFCISFVANENQNAAQLDKLKSFGIATCRFCRETLDIAVIKKAVNGSDELHKCDTQARSMSLKVYKLF